MIFRDRGSRGGVTPPLPAFPEPPPNPLNGPGPGGFSIPTCPGFLLMGLGVGLGLRSLAPSPNNTI
jgi:hypothetical protein